MTTADVKVADSSKDHPIYSQMLINKQSVRSQVDCGATVSILHKRCVEDLEIRPVPVNLKMWNNATPTGLGMCKVETVNPRKSASGNSTM